jgi:CRISPR/Cas system Type II protein with McrA/HNH and RuvC-like nuclease domain
MNYIQQEIDKFLRGEINKAQLSESLHYLIDDIVIPDAVYTKDSIDNNTLLV